MNLGFWTFGFPDVRFSRFVFAKSFWEIWWCEIDENNKDNPERPWTKWRVLNAISRTLKFQLTVNLGSERTFKSSSIGIELKSESNRSEIGVVPN